MHSLCCIGKVQRLFVTLEQYFLITYSYDFLNTTNQTENMVGGNDRHLLMQAEVMCCTVCQLPFFKHARLCE